MFETSRVKIPLEADASVVKEILDKEMGEKREGGWMY